MSTARGDLRTADDIATGGPRLAWRTRWAHWRPPGGLAAEFVQPGPFARVAAVTDERWSGRPAVITSGAWDERYRVWDVETGEPLAVPWPDEPPGPGQHEPLFPAAAERDVTPTWDDLTVFDTFAPPFVADHATIGDTVVVAGLGGLFAVQPSATTTEFELGKVHGEPMFEDHQLMPVPYTRPLPHRTGPYHPYLFETDAVRRLPDDQVPEGLAEPEARRVLTDIGLPAFAGAGLRLIALDEEELTELGVESLPEDAPSGPFFVIGTWADGTVVVRGSPDRCTCCARTAGTAPTTSVTTPTTKAPPKTRQTKRTITRPH
jgi:hypothetical protein